MLFLVRIDVQLSSDMLRAQAGDLKVFAAAEAGTEVGTTLPSRR
jgi:hypothetical protein